MRLDTESLKTACKLDISGKEQMVLRSIAYWLCISDECKISNNQIHDLTGIGLGHIGTHLKTLERRGVIWLGKGHCRKIKFNPTNEWRLKKGSEPVRKTVEPKATILKSRTVETKPKRKRNVTPEWFKELWGNYPSYRRGGNWRLGWQKWQCVELNLTQEDGKLANDWVLAAAKSCPSSWAKDAVEGFALGFVKFVGQTLWNTPVPREDGGKQKRETIDFSKLDYSQGVEEFNRA